MSHDLHVSVFQGGEIALFPRGWVVEEFGPHVVLQGEGFLELRFPGGGESCLYLADDDALDGFSVNRPCDAPELRRGILRLLRRSTMVIYGDDTPPLTGREDTRLHLPEDFVGALGEPILASDEEGLLAGLLPSDR